MNKNATETRGPGRPQKPVKFPAKAFTVEDAIDLNKGNVCALTVRHHINRGLASARLVKIANVEAEGPGRPAFRFLTASVAAKRAKDALRKRTTKTVAVTTPEPVVA